MCFQILLYSCGSIFFLVGIFDTHFSNLPNKTFAYNYKTLHAWVAHDGIKLYSRCLLFLLVYKILKTIISTIWMILPSTWNIHSNGIVGVVYRQFVWSKAFLWFRLSLRVAVVRDKYGFVYWNGTERNISKIVIK